MIPRTAPVVLAALLLPVVALGQSPAPTAAEPPPPATAHGEAPPAPAGVLRPGGAHVRAALGSDVLLASADLGVAGDLGLLSAGPGTVALGGGVDASLCLARCAARPEGAAPGVEQRFLVPHARLSYHFGLVQPGLLQRLDLYGVLTAGLTVASARYTRDGAPDHARATDAGPMAGLGAGANLFLHGNLFLGAEARLRASQGHFLVSGRVGGAPIPERATRWSLTGVNVALFLGLRL